MRLRNSKDRSCDGFEDFIVKSSEEIHALNITANCISSSFMTLALVFLVVKYEQAENRFFNALPEVLFYILKETLEGLHFEL
jgi:hypothetical protein